MSAARLLLIALVPLACTSSSVPERPGAFKMLVISTTLEFRHDSIPTCLQMLRELGQTSDPDLAAIGAPAGSQWTVDHAGDDPTRPDYFAEISAANLASYALIYSDNPTGKVFTDAPNGAEKKQVFQDYFEGGGSWAGQHSATDFENDGAWSWFQDNVDGGWFADHDVDGTPGTIVWEPAFADHPIVRGLASPWNTTDEWYIMNRDIESVPGFQVLARVTVPSSSKPNGTAPRPAVWIRENAAGGRAFYTIRGHNQKVYAEPEFRALMLRGILWAVHLLN
jgi:type 1 glutamine amidotransferase